MSILFKRWIAYFLIPAGVVLIFIPLNTHRLIGVDKEFVFLQISETLTAKVPAKTPNQVPSTDSMENLRQKLQEIKTHVSKDTSKATIANSYGYLTIQQKDLTLYPVLKKEIEDMMQLLELWRQKTIKSKRLNDLPVEEWIAFKDAFFDGSDDLTFQYGNSIFKGRVELNYAKVPVEVKNLKIGCKIVGGIFLFLSIFALHGIYVAPSKGIQIGKRIGMIIWDVIIIAMGIMFTWWFLDFILGKCFQTEIFWKDEMSGFMGVYWVAFVNLFMALITTTTSLQTLLVTSDDISLKGLFGKSVIVWSDVEDIQLSEYFVPRKAGGLVAPRKATKILVIRGGSSTLRIMEPPFALTKKEIMRTLTEYAPRELKETISSLTKEWVSVW